MTQDAVEDQSAETTGEEADEEPLLSVRDLETYFYTDEGVVHAVDGVSFDVRPGESVGIVGESGSGKSVSQISILKLIPSPPGEIVEGEIWFDGENLLEKSENEIREFRGNRISMIWQDPMSSLNPFLTIETQLTEGLMVHRDVDEEEARELAIEMLEKVGIPGARERIDEHPHQFSGGMRQRVMIAMALLCRPDLLIADEPTTALDVTIQAQILDLIKDLKRDFDTSVVVITHDLGVVAGLADRIVVMYGGRVMEEAPAGDLFEHPAHPYTVGLLKSVPRIDRGREKKLIPIEGNPPDATEQTPGCPFAERCRWEIDKCTEEFPPAVEVGADRRAHCWRAEEVFAADLGARADADHIRDVESRVEAGERIDTDRAESPGESGPTQETDHATDNGDASETEDASDHE